MLTDFEQNVLQLAARGYSVPETATELAVRRYPVFAARIALRRKFNARNITHVIALAVAMGLVAVPVGDIDPTRLDATDSAILRELARGGRYCDVARAAFVALDTVGYRLRAHIRPALHARNMRHAVAVAVQAGLIE